MSLMREIFEEIDKENKKKIYIGALVTNLRIDERFNKFLQTDAVKIHHPPKVLSLDQILEEVVQDEIHARLEDPEGAGVEITWT